jgi:WD domain, G-beta repeat
MPVSVACSHCKSHLKLLENLVGKKVKCPKCSKVFRAEGKGDEAKESRMAAGPAPATSGQRQPKSGWVDPEEAPRRRVRSRYDCDEDEDDQPGSRFRRQRGQPSNKGLILGLCLGGGGLLIGVICITILVVSNNRPPALGELAHVQNNAQVINPAVPPVAAIVPPAAPQVNLQKPQEQQPLQEQSPQLLIGRAPLIPSPLDKLDRAQMSPIHRDQLPVEAVAVIPGTGSSILSCAFSTDGKLATGCGNGILDLWDLTGPIPKQITTLKLDMGILPVERVLFSPDGKRLVAVQGGVLYLWEVAGDGAKPLAKLPPNRMDGLAIHPNNQLLVCGSNLGHFFEINAAGFRALPGGLQGANSNYSFSPDGTLFASVFFTPQRNGDLYGSEVMFWKLGPNGFADYALIQQEKTIKALAFSSDGKMLGTGSIDRQVRIWDLTASKATIKNQFAMGQWPRSVHFTYDNSHVLAFSSGLEMSVWRLDTGQKVKSLAFTPSRNTSFATGAMFLSFSGTAMAPDGRHAAFSNNNAQAVILRLF